MSVPRTYLLTAPSDSFNTFGQGKSSADMILKLKKINPRVWVESEYASNTFGIWSPGDRLGITCLWVGFPGSKTQSRKISGYKPGVLPEFTQLDPAGQIITLGWRRILEKAVQRGAARQVDVEKAFGVTLDIKEGAEDGYCPDCAMKGHKVKARSSGNLCNFHAGLVKQVEQSRQQKRDLAYLRRNVCQSTPSKVRSALTDSRQIPVSASSG